ncbi:hypothetical protein [Kitasatospora kifunensis]|uniref:Secreted protein n=1 Tax=Kitasatospora kifunensis TaxID=58351 RepID=A0A7W7VSN3_KITKI|nr:hypothetical protein [Kitasatospora kifunensis]MBB4921327.1 hypothetical protein [Kitasatospora kifunensis]
MRFTTTAGRAVAVALAAATLGLGATTSAQAATIGSIPINNGGCSVLVEVTNGELIVQALGANAGCELVVLDSASWSILAGPVPANSQVTSINVHPGQSLEVCLINPANNNTWACVQID